MSKLTMGILAVVMLVFGGMLFVRLSQPKEPMIGAEHAELTDKRHIRQGESHVSYNSSPASSGPHYAGAGAPIDWGIYTQEVPAEVYLHNEEHGGVVVTYNPKLLSAADIKKLQKFFIPGGNVTKDTFQPARFVMTPSSKDTKPIELASWKWTLSLDKYDEALLKKFYEQHVNKSPEAGAKPTNTPVNQAA